VPEGAGDGRGDAGAADAQAVKSRQKAESKKMNDFMGGILSWAS